MLMGTDDRDLDRDVAGAAGAHQRLLASLEAVDALRLDRSESARTLALLDELDTHAVAQLTAFGSVPPDHRGTDRGVDRGVDRLARCRALIWALESSWAQTVDWTVRTGPGRTRRELPFLRWRAVERCHLELGDIDPQVTYGVDDLDATYVRIELRTLEMLWRARRPMGLTPLPDALRGYPERTRLAWLLGRAELPGLPPAGLAPIVIA